MLPVFGTNVRVSSLVDAFQCTQECLRTVVGVAHLCRPHATNERARRTIDHPTEAEVPRGEEGKVTMMTTLKMMDDDATKVAAADAAETGAENET